MPSHILKFLKWLGLSLFFMLNLEQQIIEQIKKSKNILITFGLGKENNGDDIASALALFFIVKKMGKEASIVCEESLDLQKFDFLPGFGNVKNKLELSKDFIISLNTTNAKIDQIRYEAKENSLDFIITPKEGSFAHDDISSGPASFSYDLIIVLDTPDLESIGEIFGKNTDFFYRTPIINIDHHSHNEQFGQINLIELTAASTTEILYNLISENSPELLDEDIATCLLAGIIAETRSFKTQNITPQSLSATSRLVAMGARREEIVAQLYRSKSLNVLKLWGRVLARLNSSDNSALVWSILSAVDFEKTGSSEKDLSNVVEELIANIPQAKIIVLFYEKSVPSQPEIAAVKAVNAYIYTAKNINAQILARKFNPQGSRSFVKISLDMPLNEAENELIAYLGQELEKITF